MSEDDITIVKKDFAEGAFEYVKRAVEAEAKIERIGRAYDSAIKNLKETSSRKIALDILETVIFCLGMELGKEKEK